MVYDEDVCGWTIYCRPPDFPHHYVVHQWWVTDEGRIPSRDLAVLCDTLEAAREQIPVGCMRVEREPEDDVTIVETWL